MLGLVCLNHSVFPLSKDTPFECARDVCTKKFLLCESVIFNWNDGREFHNVGYCSYACALISMSTTNMPRA